MKSNRMDVLVLLTTFFLTVFFDLIIAIEVGMILSSFIFMKRMSEATAINVSNNLLSDGQEHGEVLFEDELAELPKEIIMYEINGPLFLDRKSTRLNPVTNAHLVCRLLLEKKNNKEETITKI